MSQIPPNLNIFGVIIPDGWSFELLPRELNQVLLSEPSKRLTVTIDFYRRRIRTGYNTTGTFITGHREKYSGLGWRQALIDTATTHIKMELAHEHDLQS